jgi:hypothetical protein
VVRPRSQHSWFASRPQSCVAPDTALRDGPIIRPFTLACVRAVWQIWAFGGILSRTDFESLHYVSQDGGATWTTVKGVRSTYISDADVVDKDSMAYATAFTRSVGVRDGPWAGTVGGRADSSGPDCWQGASTVLVYH